MEEMIRKDETVEDLQLNGLQLIQKKNGFRFGMDSVLLADFAEIRPGDFVVDLGCGSAILILLLIGRGKGSRFCGIDIQEDACEMAKRSVALNCLEDRVQIVQADAGEAMNLLPSCSVDAVITNPPYGLPGASLASPVPERNIARNQEPETLHRFFLSAFRILKGKGRLSLVYPAAQMLHIMDELRKCHLEPKRFRLVYPRAGQPANLVLIDAAKDSRPMLHPMPPLIVYNEQNELTNELKSVYHIKETLV